MVETTLPLGTWEIRSWVVNYDDGSFDAPFGDAPAGFIHYADDGYMFAQFMGQGGHIAYAGPYRIAGDEVWHDVTVCDRPAIVGTTLYRRFRVEGDTLTITVERTTFGARQGSAILVWQRASQPIKGTAA